MSDMIDDNRFVLIEKYKQKLIEGTNVSDSPEDMAAINSILFRFWQMGWLDKLEEEPHWIPVDLENNEPQLEEWVLVSSDGYVMQDCIVERGGKKIWYHGGNIQADDRYMPLPEPYKGVTE